MSARDRILDRVRRAGEGRADAAAVTERMTAGRQASPVPAMARTEGAARVARFLEEVRNVDATASQISGMDALPAALADELRGRNLPASVRMGADPAFAALDWSGLEVSQGPGRLEEPAGLSRALLGSAETGTLLLASGPENPVTLTFLADTHFAVVREEDICAGYEDMWARWREMGRDLNLDPRTVNLVTGPSRSADIGQTLQLGAHGPVALHVFLVAD